MKLIILFFIACIILSFFLPQQPQQNENSEKSSIGILATLSAVTSFFQDMNGFCERNPQSCTTGKTIFGNLTEKAQQGAVSVYQWLGNSFTQGAENTQEHLSNKKPSQTNDIIKEEILKQNTPDHNKQHNQGQNSSANIQPNVTDGKTFKKANQKNNHHSDIEVKHNQNYSSSVHDHTSRSNSMIPLPNLK